MAYEQVLKKIWELHDENEGYYATISKETDPIGVAYYQGIHVTLHALLKWVRAQANTKHSPMDEEICPICGASMVDSVCIYDHCLLGSYPVITTPDHMLIYQALKEYRENHGWVGVSHSPMEGDEE